MVHYTTFLSFNREHGGRKWNRKKCDIQQHLMAGTVQNKIFIQSDLKVFIKFIFKNEINNALLPLSNSHNRIVCSVCCNALNCKVKPIQMLRDRNGHREILFICASLSVRNHNNIITVHVNVSFPTNSMN
jgi:hypothetical protein